MKFHVLITDNKTGEVIRDMDTDAIMASIHSEEYTAELNLTNCSSSAYAETTGVLLKILKDIKNENPAVYRLAKTLYKKIKKEND